MNTVWSNLHVLFSLVLVTLKFRYKERNSDHCLFRNCDSDLGSMTYFCSYLSSKRREEFKEFQDFAEVNQLDILKHCQTRWLSLQKVVDRVLDQFPALLSYFTSHADVEKPGRVKRIQEQLANPLCKLSLQFLSFTLPLLNEQQIVSGLLLIDTK